MSIAERKVSKNQDLVLKVSSNIDPEKSDIKYKANLDTLHKKREYLVTSLCREQAGQKKAVRK